MSERFPHCDWTWHIRLRGARQVRERTRLFNPTADWKLARYDGATAKQITSRGTVMRRRVFNGVLGRWVHPVLDATMRRLVPRSLGGHSDRPRLVKRMKNSSSAARDQRGLVLAVAQRHAHGNLCPPQQR